MTYNQFINALADIVEDYKNDQDEQITFRSDTYMDQVADLVQRYTETLTEARNEFRPGI